MTEEYKLNFPEPFLQKHYEQYHTELAKLTKGADMNIAIYEGALIKAVVACGWLKNIKVGELPVWEVKELSAKIGEGIAERIEPPKN